MELESALAELGQGKVRPVYVLAGREQVLLTRALEAVRKATVGGGPRGLAEDHFEAREARPAVILDACKMLPMLSRWRLVLVRNIQDYKPDDSEQFLPYLEKPTPSTCLVLLATKHDGRTRFGLAVKKHDLLLSAEPYSEEQLPAFVEAEAKRRGARFEPGAAESLVLTVGANMDALVDAVERLRLFAGDRALTEADVEQLAAPLREAELEDLVDAVADRNLPRALRLLDNLLRSSKPALLVLGFLSSRLRQLTLLRDAMDRNADPFSVVRLPRHVMDRVKRQARSWSPGALAAALPLLAETDLRLKSGGGKGRDARVLEELLLRMLSSPSRAA